MANNWKVLNEKVLNGEIIKYNDFSGTITFIDKNFGEELDVELGQYYIYEKYGKNKDVLLFVGTTVGSGWCFFAYDIKEDKILSQYMGNKNKCYLAYQTYKEKYGWILESKKSMKESINWSKWTSEQYAFFKINLNSDYMIKDIQKQLKLDKYGVFVKEGWTDEHEHTIVVDSTEFDGRIFFVFKDDGYCYEYVGTNHDKVLFHKYDYVPNLFRKKDIEYLYDDSKWENKFTFVQPTIDSVVNESELILDNYVDIMNGDYTI